MENPTSFIHDYIRALTNLNGVKSIGKSGGTEIPLESGADIDLFVLCDHIPPEPERDALARSFGDVFDEVVHLGESKHWGVNDLHRAGDIEIFVMYFLIDRTVEYIDSILAGDRPDKEDGFFYPTGRCATLLNMGIFYDEVGFLQSMRARLQTYPAALSEKLSAYHISRLRDSEGFERAIMRADPFEYHAVLEISLDHFFQGIFALNRVFFPSRKRNIQYIRDFSIKPPNCEERLYQMISLGGSPETIGQSYEIWLGLIADTENLLQNK